eukprot:5041832-Amphidinium_carterae.3
MGNATPQPITESTFTGRLQAAVASLTGRSNHDHHDPNNDRIRQRELALENITADQKDAHDKIQEIIDMLKLHKAALDRLDARVSIMPAVADEYMNMEDYDQANRDDTTTTDLATGAPIIQLTQETFTAIQEVLKAYQDYQNDSGTRRKITHQKHKKPTT